MKNFSFIFGILCLLLSGCDGVAPSAKDSRPGSYSPDQAEQTPKISGLADSDAKKEITLIRFTKENLLLVANPLKVWEDADWQTQVCELAKGSQYLIVMQSEDFLKIRLDRISEKDPENCPNYLKEGYVKKEDYHGTPDDASITPMQPRRLAYDLRVHAHESLHGDPVCMIARGNPVLVREGENGIHSLQMPKSSQCDESVHFGWFKYTPGLWWDTQAQ